MSPDKQRIAIAEACGWKKRMHAPDDQIWRRSVGNSTLELHEVHLPDYPNDLDACQEFVSTLAGNDLHNYGVFLAQMVLSRENSYFKEVEDTGEQEPELNGFGFAALAHISAAQRCEAFLKTKNLWTP